MKKNKMFLSIVVLVIILLVIIYLYVAKNKNEKNNVDTEFEKKDEITLSLNEDGYFQKENINYDVLCFYDVKAILRGNNTYLIHNNGEIWEYNLSKIFTNNMNTLKLNSKIDEKIDITLIDSEDNLWFIAENKVIKVDTTNDIKTQENYETLDNVLFRGRELFLALKKNSFDVIYRLTHNQDLLVQKNNQLYKYNYVNDYEGMYDRQGKRVEYNPYLEEYKFDTGIDFAKEKIEYFDGYFIKTTNGYYKEEIINQEDVDKYANVKEQKKYIQLKSNKYIDEIIYMDGEIAVTNNKIYKKRVSR